MAWGSKGKPATRRCTACGKVKPHTRRYFPFSRRRHVLKGGGVTVRYYADSKCLSCRREWQREIRRMETVLQGKKPKGPRRKYRKPEGRARSVDVVSLMPSIERAWRASGDSREAVCARAGIDSSYWRRGRRDGRMVRWALESLLMVLGLDHLLGEVPE